MTKSQRGPSWYRIFTRTRIVAAFYLDFSKDSTVTVSLFYLLNDMLEVNFVSTLAWLLLSSVLLPLLLSGVETAWRRPLVFLGSGGWARYSANPPSCGKLWAIRIFNVICCGIVPAVLINAKEEAKAKKEHILEKVKHQYDHPEEAGAEEELHQKLRDTERYLEESKEALLTYKRNELSIENSIQISIQVLMLLLSPTYSTFITHSGLQAVFQKDFAVQTEIQSRIENLSGYESDGELSFNLTQWFLVLSILWSMKTISLTYVKVKAAGKVEVLALPAKLLLAVRSLLVYSVRLSCVVAFFGPFLGLFNVLAHWRAEQLVLEFKVFNRNQIFTSPEMSGSLPIDAIYRANYSTTDPEHPSYTLYTQVTLGTSFAFFLVLIVTQALVNLLLETKLSREFKEAGWTAKMQHLLESVNRADSFSDWDMGQGSPSEFRRRWWNVMAETIAMIGVQLGTNLALLIPLWVTTWNVHKRHQQLIEVEMVVFKEETEALELLVMLSWAMPLMVVSTSFLDTLLMVLYQKWLHPWRKILAKEKETPVDSPMPQGLLQEPQNIAEEEEETCEDAQTPTSQGISKEPAHSSEA